MPLSFSQVMIISQIQGSSGRRRPHRPESLKPWFPSRKSLESMYLRSLLTNHEGHERNKDICYDTCYIDRRTLNTVIRNWKIQGGEDVDVLLRPDQIMVFDLL